MNADRLERLLDLALVTLRQNNDPKAEAVLMVLAEALKEAESQPTPLDKNSSLPGPTNSGGSGL